MNLSESQFEVIEAYLANELSPTDRASFETDIAQNPNLRTEVFNQQYLRLGLRALGIERALEQAKAQYKATSNAIEGEEKGQNVATELPTSEPVHQPEIRPLRSWRYWAGAASVVVVLGVGYIAYQQTNSTNTDLAYAETFTPTPTDQLLKDFPSGPVAPATRNQFLAALKNYKAGKYDNVIAQLKTLPADKQTVHYRNYFLGLTHLANKQSAEAIPLLTQAQASPDGKIRQKAEWFLALAYVKNGQKEKARPILNRISTNRANPFNKLAQQVLKKIE